jgi:hypothetical protein
MKEVIITSLDAQAQHATTLSVGDTLAHFKASDGRSVLESEDGETFTGWLREGNFNTTVGIRECQFEVEAN